MNPKRSNISSMKQEIKQKFIKTQQKNRLNKTSSRKLKMIKEKSMKSSTKFDKKSLRNT